MNALLRAFILLLFIFPAVSIAQDNMKSVNPGSEKKSQDHISDRSAGSIETIQGNTGGGGYKSAGFEGPLGMYLNSDWQPGYIVLVDGSSIDALLLRYDIYNQQMQFIRNEDTMAIGKPDEVSYLLIGSRKFIFNEYSDDGAIRKGYFEVLTDGDCKLLYRRYVKYHYDEADFKADKKESFEGDTQYFIRKKGDKVARQIIVNKKSVLCAFADREKQVRDFIKVNELKIRTGNELKQVVDFYNSLK